jgi:hypothetical protein
MAAHIKFGATAGLTMKLQKLFSELADTSNYAPFETIGTAKISFYGKS